MYSQMQDQAGRVGLYIAAQKGYLRDWQAHLVNTLDELRKSNDDAIDRRLVENQGAIRLLKGILEELDAARRGPTPQQASVQFRNSQGF